MSGKAAIARQREAAGRGGVGDDGDDPRVDDASRVDCIRDRFEVGAAAGEQDREAPGGRNLGFQSSESTPAGVDGLDRIRSNNRDPERRGHEHPLDHHHRSHRRRA